MNIILYDGTFEGLLTAIYEGFYMKKDDIEIYKDHQYQKSMFNEETYVYPDVFKATKVSDAILSKLGEDVYTHILYAFLSEDMEMAISIYEFLKYAFKHGPNVIQQINHEKVNPMYNLYRKVTRESHLMLGLIRFVELKSGIYYCAYEPSYNILTLMAPHFSKRLGDQNWVIHDLKRNIAAFYNKETWYINELDNSIPIDLCENELEFQILWKQYYKSIAIKERINHDLRRSHMPKKYWKYLIELK